MPRTHVLLLENIHRSAAEMFEAAGHLVTALPKSLEPAELARALADVDPNGAVVLGIRSKTQLRGERLADPRLVAIGTFCIGTDQVDLAEAQRHGVPVFNAPFSSTRSVAELVLGEILMLFRQVTSRSAAAHQGLWRKDAEGAHEVRGKRLGIVGYGHIGSQLSVLAEALGMQVRYYDTATKLPLGNARACASLHELLADSDLVTLHVPDTDRTRNLIGPDELRAIPKGGYLINASRGQVVDIDALCHALDESWLAGAALDVFPTEPASKDERFTSPLQGRGNVILTPHIGGSTVEAQAAIGREVAAAVLAYLETGRTAGSVNLPVLDAPRAPGSLRLVNVHHNVPGVLSATNRVIAESNVNIAAQHLATLGEVGVLLIDVTLEGSDPRAAFLRDAIATLPTSVRTRLI